jgi:hypothetical protein
MHAAVYRRQHVSTAGYLDGALLPVLLQAHRGQHASTAVGCLYHCPRLAGDSMPAQQQQCVLLHVLLQAQRRQHSSSDRPSTSMT